MSETTNVVETSAAVIGKATTVTKSGWPVPNSHGWQHGIGVS